MGCILFWKDSKGKGKWAVIFGFGGQKKEETSETLEWAKRGEGGLERNMSRLCHTVHRHNLLTQWALYLLRVTDPLLHMVAHTRSPQRTIQSHSKSEDFKLSGNMRNTQNNHNILMSSLLPVVSLTADVPSKNRVQTQQQSIFNIRSVVLVLCAFWLA